MTQHQLDHNGVMRFFIVIVFLSLCERDVTHIAEIVRFIWNLTQIFKCYVKLGALFLGAQGLNSAYSLFWALEGEIYIHLSLNKSVNINNLCFNFNDCWCMYDICICFMYTLNSIHFKMRKKNVIIANENEK